jgi:DNA-binding transcriptional regulator YhcF (GntR family)
MTLGVKIDKAESIRNYISQKIKTRDYVDRIPSLNQLAGHFNVNVKTAKRAVGELERAGVLFSQKGKGTFVNQKTLHPAPFLFVGREHKEISGVISSVLASAVKLLGLNYCPYTFLIPPKIAGQRFTLPKFKDLAGILIEGSLVDDFDFKDIDVPVVQLHGISTCRDYFTVSPDVEGGIKQALDYLKSLGHQKIAYLGPALSQECEELERVKRNYFFKCAEQLKMTTKPEWSPEAYYRVEAGYESAMKVLSLDDRPTAIVCVNDEVALGVLNACDDLGLQVPYDVSVVGFDDRVPAVMRKPFLTSVKVDFKQIAIEGVKLMHQSVQNENHSHNKEDNIVVPTHLIIRETTGRVAE